MVRGGKGREGEDKWGCAAILESSGQPRGGWTSCPLAFALNPKMCLPGVCGNGRKKIIFEISKFSSLGANYIG
jgi:hypothetical protein